MFVVLCLFNFVGKVLFLLGFLVVFSCFFWCGGGVLGVKDKFLLGVGVRVVGGVKVVLVSRRVVCVVFLELLFWVGKFFGVELLFVVVKGCKVKCGFWVLFVCIIVFLILVVWIFVVIFVVILVVGFLVCCLCISYMDSSFDLFDCFFEFLFDE